MHVLLSAGFAFILALFSMPLIIKVAKDKHLFDNPDDRKVHTDVIPTLGGLGIFVGFIVAFLIGVPEIEGLNMHMQFIVAAFVVMFFVGIKDDLVELSATKKFIAQIIAAAIIIFMARLSIHNLYGFFGVGEINEGSTGSFALTFLLVVFLTNAINLIDGIDGLAGSLTLLSTIIFGTYFYYVGEIGYSVLSFSIASSVLAFLIYNFSPAKIFMGDTGSLILGLANAILVIKFLNTEGSKNVISETGVLALALSILVVPITDTLRVFSIRIFNRRSPFSPDRNHIHHLLLDIGLSHRAIVFILCGFTLVTIFITYLLTFVLNTTLICFAIIAWSLIWSYITYKLKLKADFSKEKSIKDKELFINSNHIVEEKERTN